MSGRGLKIMYKVEEIEWEDIKEVWEQHLWPEKKGGVKQTNNWTLTMEPYLFTTVLKKAAQDWPQRTAPQAQGGSGTAWTTGFHRSRP